MTKQVTTTEIMKKLERFDKKTGKRFRDSNKNIKKYIDGKFEEQSRNQIGLAVHNFGVIYMIFGFTILATAIIYIDPESVLNTGFFALAIGIVIILLSKKIGDLLFKFKKK